MCRSRVEVPAGGPGKAPHFFACKSLGRYVIQCPADVSVRPWSVETTLFGGRRKGGSAGSRPFFGFGSEVKRVSSASQRAQAVRALLEKPVAAEGFELIDVELVMEGRKQVLRLYIDTVPPGTKEAGVTVEHCSLVSRLAGDILDVEDSIAGEYNLEVSSPGLFRPLTRPEHFDRVLGSRIKVKTFEKLDGRKVFTGILTRREGDNLMVSVDGQDFALALSKVAKANLEPIL